jgi:hypothetical protein
MTADQEVGTTSGLPALLDLRIGSQSLRMGS